MDKMVSAQDIEHLVLLRTNVNEFLARVAKQYSRGPSLLLDIAPQAHKGARPFFEDNVQIETLDIDAASGATHIANLCDLSQMPGINRYDFVVCTEVLEHTRQPFHAVSNIYSMLKKGGYAFVTTPFNFRIHGPLPDCWRFTEHGLRELFKDFDITELEAMETKNRFLMPIQYTLVARKPGAV